jgi:hypothetical protein
MKACEPAFVEAWGQLGGRAGDERLIAWLEDNREPFLQALRTSFNP